MSSESIFDYSKKMGSYHKKKAPPVQKSTQQPTAPSAAKLITDEEAREMINKIKEMHDDIEMKIEQACRENNVTIEGIIKYLGNPNNFRSNEWEFIKIARVNELNKFWSLFGDEEKAKHIQQVEDKQGKAKRSKSVGFRRQGWIPMS